MMQLYTTLCRQQNMDAGRAKRLPENGQIFMCIRDHRLQNDWIWQLTLHSILQTIPAIAETVPTAIGIFIAERGDSMKCICDGVNIGDETSAIASIVGALCGTFRGSRSFPEDYLDFLNEQNGFDLELQAGAVLSACENLS